MLGFYKLAIRDPKGANAILYEKPLITARVTTLLSVMRRAIDFNDKHC
jgi:hypothetical protein